MYRQGISSNIMSLGGIAIAIGAMVDAVIIMIENAHKHIERDGGRKPHWQIIRNASTEVGPTLFYSLLVITVSFIPVFALQAQEGRLFKPLAYTKTYSMAAAALLSITLAPVLMGYFIRGQISGGREESDQSLSHQTLSSGDRFRDPLALVRYRRRCRRRSYGCFSPGTGWSQTVCLKARCTSSLGTSANFFRIKVSAPSSCRRFTKAICFTCRLPFPAFR